MTQTASTMRVDAPPSLSTTLKKSPASLTSTTTPSMADPWSWISISSAKMRIWRQTSKLSFSWVSSKMFSFFQLRLLTPVSFRCSFRGPYLRLCGRHDGPEARFHDRHPSDVRRRHRDGFRHQLLDICWGPIHLCLRRSRSVSDGIRSGSWERRKGLSSKKNYWKFYCRSELQLNSPRSLFLLPGLLWHCVRVFLCDWWATSYFGGLGNPRLEKDPLDGDGSFGHLLDLLAVHAWVDEVVSHQKEVRQSPGAGTYF